MNRTQPLDQATLWRIPRLDHLELMRATYSRLEFPRHTHPTYVVELVEAGVDEFECADGLHRARAGEIILINPHEPHTGRSAGRTPLRYRSLYPTVPLLLRIAERAYGPGVAPPHFDTHVVRDPLAWRTLQRWHESAEPGRGPRDDGDLAGGLVRLVEQFARSCPRARPATSDVEIAKRARELILRNLGRNVTLDALAARVGTGAIRLLRVFRSVYGLPPHEFLVSARVQRARALLASGRSISAAAFEAGFCDQAHLTRCFRSRVGVTPGEYARKNVQDVLTAAL
jgi:AraC-like DNA-binding protein